MFVAKEKWNLRYKLNESKPIITDCKKLANGYELKGIFGVNCLKPTLEFSLRYTIENNKLNIAVAYDVSKYVQCLPRFGLEFALDKKYSEFAYIAYGPYESYVDKHVACEYGYHESNASENYEYGYVRPQESGSHYYAKYMEIKKLFAVTAQKPFSFSIHPYTTAQLRDTTHTFELPKNDYVNVCIDVMMRGVGSSSCGPELESEYEILKTNENVFTIAF